MVRDAEAVLLDLSKVSDISPVYAATFAAVSRISRVHGCHFGITAAGQAAHFLLRMNGILHLVRQ
jgi:hypothetical protein